MEKWGRNLAVVATVCAILGFTCAGVNYYSDHNSRHNSVDSVLDRLEEKIDNISFQLEEMEQNEERIDSIILHMHITKHPH